MSSAGIAAVTQGMAAAESITNKIGINLSNANTPGYKGFGNYLLSETSKYNGGVNAVSRTKANIQGEISETKNEFDYAVEGEGFFVVKCGDQMKYTRAGRFETDNQDYIKSPNGCYLLGEPYSEKDQQQVADIEKENLVPIKLDKSPTLGKATTSADVSLSLSAKQMALGGGKGNFVIDTATPGTWNNNDQFELYFYEKKGDDPSREFKYNFVYDSDPANSSYDSTTNTIKFDSANKLATLVNNNLGQFINLTVDSNNKTVNFEIKSSSGNNVLAQFVDSVANPVLGKLAINNFIDSKGYVKPNYNPKDSSLNIAGGKIRADAKTEFNIIDSLGEDHEVYVAFKKIATMKYAVEVYTAKSDDVKNNRSDGLIAAGNIKFDHKGNGTLEDITGLTGVKKLTESLEFNWNPRGQSQAAPNNIKINWNKMQMYDDNQLINIDSDGKKGGTLMSTSIDDKGNLTAHYTNGDDKKLAAIPLALFKDPLKLQNEFGTVFSNTAESGNPMFKVAAKNGVGKIVSGSLEGSNVDETKSMTDLMKQQRFYSYNAKSYGMMNNMEDVLLNVIRV